MLVEFVRVHVVIDTCHECFSPINFFYSLFLQYVDHGISQLTGEFMAQILAGTGIFLILWTVNEEKTQRTQLLKHIIYVVGITDVLCDDMINAISC